MATTPNELKALTPQLQDELKIWLKEQLKEKLKIQIRSELEWDHADISVYVTYDGEEVASSSDILSIPRCNHRGDGYDK